MRARRKNGRQYCRCLPPCSKKQRETKTDWNESYCLRSLFLIWQCWEVKALRSLSSHDGDCSENAQNNRFDERIHNNASARAYHVHFFAVPCKRTTRSFGEHESLVTLVRLKYFKILDTAKYFKIPRIPFSSDVSLVLPSSLLSSVCCFWWIYMYA